MECVALTPLWQASEILIPTGDDRAGAREGRGFVKRDGGFVKPDGRKAARGP